MRGQRGSWGRKAVGRGIRTSVACTQGLSHTQTVEIGVCLGCVGGQVKPTKGGAERKRSSTTGDLLPSLPEGAQH